MCGLQKSTIQNSLLNTATSLKAVLRVLSFHLSSNTFRIFSRTSFLMPFVFLLIIHSLYFSLLLFTYFFQFNYCFNLLYVIWLPAASYNTSGTTVLCGFPACSCGKVGREGWLRQDSTVCFFILSLFRKVCKLQKQHLFNSINSNSIQLKNIYHLVFFCFIFG